MIFKNVTFYNEVFQKDVADIQVENGRITAIGVLEQEGRDMQGYTLLPGFVDIHIHGRGGGDFSDGTVSSMDRISASLAKCGVTAFCGTTMTLPREKLTDILVTARGYMGKEAGARLLGVNLEPEAFDSADLIRQISGCCRVSLGHSCATAEEANAAFDAGAGHVTHLFNAMPPMNHRVPGLPGAALDRSDVTCELICDGGHIDPIMLRNAFRLLGQDRACVISDSMRAAGLGPGTYELGGQTVYVKENGRYAVLEDGTIAASITDLFTEFKNLLRFGIDFETALRSCTINPARAIGMDDQIGSIATGKYADLLFVDEDLNVAEVYVDGIQA